LSISVFCLVKKKRAPLFKQSALASANAVVARGNHPLSFLQRSELEKTPTMRLKLLIALVQLQTVAVVCLMQFNSKKH
jgi:hypothetical protein